MTLEAGRLLRLILGIIIFGLVIFYGILKTKDLFQGPELSVTSPGNGAYIERPVTMVEGNTKRVQRLRINGREIALGEDGYFRDVVVLSPPLTHILVEAEDRFGKKKTISLAVAAKNN